MKAAKNAIIRISTACKCFLSRVEAVLNRFLDPQKLKIINKKVMTNA